MFIFVRQIFNPSMNNKFQMTSEEIEKDACSAAKSHVFGELKEIEDHIARVLAVLKDENN